MFIPKAPVAAGLVFLLATTTASFALSNADFLDDAIQGDNSEILLGQLAATKGGSDQVKQFGRTLADDHTQNRTQADAILQGYGMIASSAASSEAADELGKLNTLSGAAFDREFASYMIRDHEKDIWAFKQEAAYGRGPVKEFAAKSLPTLEKHLQMAETIAKSSS
jgi:putative membrane protein